jgi:hypothetical protein
VASRSIMAEGGGPGPGGRRGGSRSGEAGRWRGTQTTLDAHLVSQRPPDMQSSQAAGSVFDSRMNPDRAARMSLPPTSDNTVASVGCEDGTASHRGSPPPSGGAAALASADLRPISEEDEIELLIEATPAPALPQTPDRVDDRNV